MKKWLFVVALFLVSLQAAFAGSESKDLLYKQTYESFVKEDYSKVEILSNQFLKLNPKGPDAEDIQQLKAISLVKMGREAEARQILDAIERA